MSKKVIIIGAGPGGLTAGMILANRGYKVEIFEAQEHVGGRTAPLCLGDYTFDTGPTFLMLPHVLEEMFELAGRKLSDYLELLQIDPLYRLRFRGEQDFFPSSNREQMVQEIERVFPGDGSNYEHFMRDEAKKYEAIFPCLQATYLKPTDYCKPGILATVPKLDLGRSVYDVLTRYFTHEDMRIAMTFQAKYLGMSPWECPGFFAILCYLEHQWGIWHPRGGLYKITEAMSTVMQEHGGTVHLNTPVDQLLIQNGTATGVRLESGEEVVADRVVLNADFAHAMTHVVPEEYRPKYSNKKLAAKRYSCSTFMLYLALDKKYNIAHHNIIFADDYKHNVAQIVGEELIGEDFSFYIQNASATDDSLAPAGCSGLYVLVPLANLNDGTNWQQYQDQMTERVLSAIESRTELTDLRQHIIDMKVLTPQHWQDDYRVYKGAVFNLAHNLGQMMYFRPRNKFECFKNCYLVGGGTHPGSGLPTIFESGKICANLIDSQR